MAVNSDRLQRTLDYLKSEFRAAGSEWVETHDRRLLENMQALVGAINEIEIFMYDKRITTLFDAI